MLPQNLFWILVFRADNATLIPQMHSITLLKINNISLPKSSKTTGAIPNMNALNTNDQKKKLDSKTITRIASGIAILLLISSLYSIMFNSAILATGVVGYAVVLLFIVLLVLYVVSLTTGELFADYMIQKRQNRS